MNDSKIKNEQYIPIQGWMVNELKLKGNDLIIYAIIYMFSQAEDQKYNGSLQYLANWTNSSKQGVQKNLKSLIDKNLVKKEVEILNGVNYCSYYATKFHGVCNKVSQGIQQSCTEHTTELHGGIQQSCTNNKEINNNITSLKVSIDTYREIIDYMNTVNEHHTFEKKQPFFYKATSKDTQRYINARLREGYDIEDFKDVIYFGYLKFVEKEFQNEQGDSSVKYFRPSTLFSDKHFGEYLNEYRSTCGK